MEKRLKFFQNKKQYFLNLAYKKKILLFKKKNYFVFHHVNNQIDTIIFISALYNSITTRIPSLRIIIIL